MQIRFLGAAGNVTGSRFLLDTGSARILVDCGMYQEHRLKDRNWDDFGFKPRDLDAVLLTHAHLDHCGLLPKLCRDGFRGPIYTTPASAEIAKIILLDAGHMQEEDAKYKAKRHARQGRKSKHPPVPLYTVEDAKAVLPQFEPRPYAEPFSPVPGVEVAFHDAGHILGSSFITLDVGGKHPRRLLFSGDIGRNNRPILRDPSFVERADYVIMESTYGDRCHPPEEDDVEALLAEAIHDTIRRGGNLLIPVFAVERSQEILYHLHRLLRAKRIPQVMAFLDSPMAVEVTHVFRRHPELFDKETSAMLASNESPFETPGLKLVRTADSSKAINNVKGTCVILAGSGMCTGGRIKHHLVHNLGRPESTVLFVGYQAQGTLGRQILEGEPEVRIFGEVRPVRANVRRISGFSGHADRDELTRWITHLKTKPKQVFVVHGERSASEYYADHLAEQTGWSVQAPKYGEKVELE